MKHVHAELMALYAQDAMETDKPWERWELKDTYQTHWTACKPHICFDDSLQYRRKPRTIKVNGFDVPEPMRGIEQSQNVWWASPDEECFAAELDFYRGSPWRERLLSRGLIHSTKEAAAKHAMAMCGIDPATYKEEQ
jgi:hypothetical protein